jgi:phosphate transport system substrate-binding protein
MRREPGTAVRVTGGGSGAGVDALVAGSADIAAVSRPLDPSEVQALYRTHGTLGVRFRIARDGVSVFLNPDNTVRDLSLAELAALFTGRITSWSEVGGPAVAVRLVVRPPNSGTTRFVRDHVLAGARFGSSATVAPTTRAVIAAVAADAGAIGFGGVAYRTDAVITCRIDGVGPDAGSIRDERYPLARYLQLVTVAPPGGTVRRFLDFCLGPEGQRMVAESGYLPLWSPDRGTSASTAPAGSRN